MIWMVERWVMAVAVVGSAASAEPLTANRPQEVQFARTHIGDFDVVAQTKIEWRDDQPYPGDVTCVAHTSAFRLQVGPYGRLDFSLDPKAQVTRTIRPLSLGACAMSLR